MTAENKNSDSTEEERKFLSKRILELRMHLEKNQKEFAALVGISNTKISDYEKGVNLPSFPRLRKMADNCGISLDYFRDDLPPFVYYRLQQILEDAKLLAEIPEPIRTYKREEIKHIRNFSILESHKSKREKDIAVALTKKPLESPTETYKKLFKDDLAKFASQYLEENSI